MNNCKERNHHKHQIIVNFDIKMRPKTGMAGTMTEPYQIIVATFFGRHDMLDACFYLGLTISVKAMRRKLTNSKSKQSVRLKMDI